MIPQRETMSHFVTAGLTLLAPVSALAQPAPAASTAAAATAPKWRFQVSADGSWYENPYFVGADEGAAWSTSGRASLALEQSYRRGSVSLSGYGGSIYYPEIDTFNQATYGGNFGLSWAPSTRTQVQVGQTYDRSNTRALRSLDPEGLAAPHDRHRHCGDERPSSRTSFSQSWQIGLDGAFTWRQYDNEALVGGEQLYSSLQLGKNAEQEQHGVPGLRLFLGLVPGHRARRPGCTRPSWARQNRREHVGWQIGGGVAYVESVGQFYPGGARVVQCPRAEDRARRSGTAAISARRSGTGAR